MLPGITPPLQRNGCSDCFCKKAQACKTLANAEQSGKKIDSFGESCYDTMVKSKIVPVWPDGSCAGEENGRSL